MREHVTFLSEGLNCAGWLYVPDDLHDGENRPAIVMAHGFSALKEMLNITDGNLASHIKALEKEKYVSVNKTFVDRKPNTKYKITEKGRNAFRKHLDALEAVIKQQK